MHPSLEELKNVPQFITWPKKLKNDPSIYQSVNITNGIGTFATITLTVLASQWRNGDKNQLKRLKSVDWESLILKPICCTGERRKKEIIKRIQKHMSKYRKMIFRGTFKMDRNRMKPVQGSLFKGNTGIS